MLKSLINIFNKPQNKTGSKIENSESMLFCGIMVEAASIDGKIENNEITKIENSIIELFKFSRENAESLVKKCLDNANGPNSLYYFSSKINKEFDHSKKISLLEILWEIILADGTIHDFESNLVRRLAGLLYLSDIECGNAKKRALTKLEQNKDGVSI